MRGKTFRVVVFLVVCLFSILAWSDCGMAQQQTESKPAVNPLVRVLQAKGILTADDVAQITQASSANDADQRLAKLLLMKGVITQADYDQTVGLDKRFQCGSEHSYRHCCRVPRAHQQWCECRSCFKRRAVGDPAFGSSRFGCPGGHPRRGASARLAD